MNDQDRKKINENNHAMVERWKPGNVFTFFADLSAIPRGSGNVKDVAVFLENFAKERGYESEKDLTGNVIIRKPAQKSSSTKGVILQAHQDMVCVKNDGTDHDFMKDPVEFVEKGEYLYANNTTLGADDGIGVALALAVLDDHAISHPPLEALFTVDEETDMKGAKKVTAESLQGETLINLDAEDLGIAYVSSAAGVSSTLAIKLETEKETEYQPVYFTIKVDGLLGGHSGIEINKARANAYVLLARILTAIIAEKIDFTLYRFDQGKANSADNAIAATAEAVIGVKPDGTIKNLEKIIQGCSKDFRNEFRVSDREINGTMKPAEAPGGSYPPLAAKSRNILLNTILLLPLGVFRFIQKDDLMETAYGDLLVETSCNMGIVSVKEGLAKLILLARGSTRSVLDDLVGRLSTLAEVVGGDFTITNSTAGWEMPAHTTPVQKLFEDAGLACLGVHAGLECGCLVETFKNCTPSRSLDAISVGPTLQKVHSTQERLEIKTVDTLWHQLVSVLSKL